VAFVVFFLFICYEHAIFKNIRCQCVTKLLMVILRVFYDNKAVK